jgi:YbbR domain-containing protein
MDSPLKENLAKDNLVEKKQKRAFWFSLVERIFLRDWGTKLIALAISIALWFGVSGKTVSRRIQNVQLNLLPANEMQIRNEPPNEIEITVTGDKQKIDRLTKDDLIVSVDLSETLSGDRILELSPETVNLELPSGIRLAEIQPNKIAVVLEKVVEREIDVKPVFEGSLADGFEIYQKIVTPSKVRLRGPESMIKSLDSISTERIDILDKNESFTEKQIGLNGVDPKITVIDTIFDVNVIIGEKRIEKSFSTEIDGKNISFVLLGSRAEIDSIKIEDLKITLEQNPDGKFVANIEVPGNLSDRIEVKSKKVN